MPGVTDSLAGMIPELILAGSGLLLLLADLPRRRGIDFCAGAGMLAAVLALAAATGWPGSGSVFHGQIRLDGLAHAGRILVMGTLLLTLLVSPAYVRAFPVGAAEYSALLLFAGAALCGVASSGNWLVLFIFLELAAICFAALLGGRRDARPAGEAALKYFILSAFASAFLLYGIAVNFLVTGSFSIAPPGNSGTGGFLALYLILAGLAFKCALVPFHMWAPDAYQGGPTPVVGFLASASKAAGFLVLARIFLAQGPVKEATWVLWAGCALSMAVGTVLALTQRNTKRMLAYSGIAHAGYLATALVAGTPAAFEALLFYLPVYALMTFGAFAVLASLEAAGVNPDLTGLSGLGRRTPVGAAALAVFMVSLIGLPPSAGFLAKFILFREVFFSGHPWLVLLGLGLSVVSVGFYLRLLVPVFMETPVSREDPVKLPAAGLWAAALLAVAILILGLVPGPILDFAHLAGR